MKKKVERDSEKGFLFFIVWRVAIKMISKQFRRIFMWILITFGIGVLILVQVVAYNGLTDWQDSITRIVWVYLIVVFIYNLFLNVIPMVWDHIKKK